MALGDHRQERFDIDCVSVVSKFTNRTPGSSHMYSIIGEDKALSIKIGSQAKMDGDTTLREDAILVRGPSSDVTRAIEAIKQLAEKAKNDEIESSYVCAYVWCAIHSAGAQTQRSSGHRV
jgi:hypothetical protein